MLYIDDESTIDSFLSHEDCAGFWREAGTAFSIPYMISCLYESGKMMLIEPIVPSKICGVHLICMKGSRGRDAVIFSKKCLKFIKSTTECRILTKIQLDRKDALAMARMVGMKRINQTSTHFIFEAFI